MAYLDLFRSQISQLFDAFIEATGYSPTTASRIITGDPKFLSAYSTRDMRVGTFDAAVARFSALWPDEVSWPSGIERPAPATVDAETLRLVRARANPPTNIHPDWPADKPWPADIPRPVVDPQSVGHRE